MSKILVVGDSCTDVFIYGDIERICPEAPVPVINPTRKTKNGGMSKNVKANIEALGCEVTIVTNPNNIKKIRYVDNSLNQLVLRVDEHDCCKQINDKQLKYIKDNEFDAVVISDYCKGFLNEENIEYICKNNHNVFVDTKKKLGDWILRADFIKINHIEYLKNFNIIEGYSELKDKLIVTQGPRGCIFKDEVFPVEEVLVKDVSGAGDTFLSGLVVEYLKSGDIKKSINFAQECTTKVVQKSGVSTI